MVDALLIVVDEPRDLAPGDFTVVFELQTLALSYKRLNWISDPIRLALAELAHQDLEKGIRVLIQNEELILAGLDQSPRT